MRNRFPGTCYRCGRPVEVGAGHFEKIVGGGPVKWRTQHAECAIWWRGEPAPTREVAAARYDACVAAPRRLALESLSYPASLNPSAASVSQSSPAGVLSVASSQDRDTHAQQPSAYFANPAAVMLTSSPHVTSEVR